MPLQERVKLIQKIEAIRGSKVICFLTSLRQNVPGIMAEDAVRMFFDQLILLPNRPVEKLDIFLVSNGGNSTVPWRLVALFREFSKAFNVLIPYRAYSAASLLALGADEITMHPFGELGPIDPTVSNAFNPTDPSGRQLGISVEDVRSYIHFIKSTVGITHDDELIKAVEILANKVHPLALGNVERFISQSRMVARKILRTHMSDEDEEHEIDDIVENMASKLFFHGHPINRKEAKKELKLKINDDLQPELESAMWDLYKDFEKEFENMAEFNPASLIANLAPVPVQPGQPVLPKQVTCTLLFSCIESARLSCKYLTERRYTEFQTMQMQGQMPVPGQMLREEILSQGWKSSPVVPTV